jgi:Acyl-CoA dehydrogenase, C-terminal domain
VPDDFVIPVLDQKPIQPGALYSTPLITLFAACIGCVAIGIARGAIDAFVALAEKKTPLGSSVLLRDKPSAQIDLARAEALLGAGRGHLFETVEGLWDEAASGRPSSLKQRALVRIATAQAAAMSAQAVDLLYNASGGSGLYETNPLERCVELCNGTLMRANNGEVVIFTSALSIAEVLWMRNAPMIPEDRAEIVRKFFRRSYFRIRNVTRAVAENAQDLSVETWRSTERRYTPFPRCALSSIRNL